MWKIMTGLLTITRSEEIRSSMERDHNDITREPGSVAMLGRSLDWTAWNEESETTEAISDRVFLIGQSSAGFTC